MGDFYPDYDPSREWWPGDPPPKGGPLERDDKDKEKPARESGDGTLESPKVISPTLPGTVLHLWISH